MLTFYTDAREKIKSGEIGVFDHYKVKKQYMNHISFEQHLYHKFLGCKDNKPDQNGYVDPKCEKCWSSGHKSTIHGNIKYNDVNHAFKFMPVFDFKDYPEIAQQLGLNSSEIEDSDISPFYYCCPYGCQDPGSVNDYSPQGLSKLLIHMLANHSGVQKTVNVDDLERRQNGNYN